MNKLIYSFFAGVLALGAISCSSDNDSPDGPSPVVPESYGVFVVNAGNMYGNIDGSLGYYEFGTGQYFEDVFKGANDGMKVGDIFNSGYILDDYIYLAVTNSAVLHVINREDFKLVKSIETRSEAGPRHITSYNGKIYMTLFGMPGYVAEVDPATLEITREVEVGPLPEEIKVCNDKLYVAVSDGYSDGSQASVTVIDPATFKVTATITGIVNPVNVVTNGSNVYVCSWGQYQNEYPYEQYNYGVYEVKGDVLSEKLFDATNITIGGNVIYYFNAPYGKAEITYGAYDTATTTNVQWITSAEGVELPISLAADPSTGDVFILSYHLGEGGYGSYNTPGYVKQYHADGSVVRMFDAGISPTSLFFNAK